MDVQVSYILTASLPAWSINYLKKEGGVLFVYRTEIVDLSVSVTVLSIFTVHNLMLCVYHV